MGLSQFIQKVKVKSFNFIGFPNLTRTEFENIQITVLKTLVFRWKFFPTVPSKWSVGLQMDYLFLFFFFSSTPPTFQRLTFGLTKPLMKNISSELLGLEPQAMVVIISYPVELIMTWLTMWRQSNNLQPAVTGLEYKDDLLQDSPTLY